jgi:hypothetical protein
MNSARRVRSRPIRPVLQRTPHDTATWLRTTLPGTMLASQRTPHDTVTWLRTMLQGTMLASQRTLHGTVVLLEPRALKRAQRSTSTGIASMIRARFPPTSLGVRTPRRAQRSTTLRFLLIGMTQCRRLLALRTLKRAQRSTSTGIASTIRASSPCDMNRTIGGEASSLLPKSVPTCRS